MVDEKTGIGVHEPTTPSQPVAPDRPARQEFEYVRHGTADRLAAFALLTGRFQFHWLPVHGSGLSFIEVWFAIRSKKCLARSEWTEFDAAAKDILAFIATYDTHHAHPVSWRKGIKFYQRLKDKLAQKQATEPPSMVA